MRLAVDRQTPAAGRRFCRHHKLRRSADFLRCYRRGRKLHGSLVTLHYYPNEAPTARLGITASRKVGKSVVRHLCKRRVRETFRCWDRRADLDGLDVVVHLRPEAGRADRQTFLDDLLVALERLRAQTVDRAARVEPPPLPEGRSPRAS